MSINELIQKRIDQNREFQKSKFYQSIPHKLRDYELENLLELDSSYNNLTAQGKRTLQRFLDEPTPFLLLHGASGLGKTVIGASISLEMLKRKHGHSALYLSTTSLLSELSYGSLDGKNKLDIIKQAISPDILFLDDVGAGTSMSTQTRRDGIWEIIDRRWSAEHKITVMTTNLPISKESSQGAQVSLPEWFGPSAWDRISGTGTLTAVHFVGTSLRGKNSNKDNRNDRKRSKRTSTISKNERKRYDQKSLQDIDTSSTIPKDTDIKEENRDSYNDFEGYDD